jgi:predicted amidohydrolase
MVATIKKYKAAAVNAEPGWLNLELSIQKTIHWINEAGQNGCKLIAFPELCKYTPFSPIYLSSDPITKQGFPATPTGCGASTTKSPSLF